MTESPAGAPLASLAGGALARRFHSWRGASGARYICSVFAATALDELASYADAVVIGVVAAGEGDLRVVLIGESGSLPEVFWQGEFARRARAAGVNEFHLHLLTERAEERRAVMGDLTRQMAAKRAS
ncbi:hypothetical protein [Methylovirgula sp. 4M-Z18]|uniref:hypothetical protein n=1 Tax=Methylovirgula sp. 4M-Z18 TaxID=2293567 RepID=UPI000E3885BE|nr:hypothetical protein DYH55_11890 [Methylovirgula sp. 4M-Z18]